MAAHMKLYPVLIFALLAAGCTTQPAPTSTPTPALVVVNPPPSPTAEWYGEGMPPYPWPPTATPVPTPNAAELEATRIFLLTPSPTPWPTPLIYGMEEAPAEEQEEYFSSTLVIAPFGAGPGEVGYSAPTAEGGGDCCREGFEYAGGLAVDPQGNVYVLDPANDRLVQFDSQGRFIRNIASPQVDPEHGFAVDGAGRFYFFDFSDSMGIDCYDDTGLFLQHLPWPGGTWEVNHLYIDVQGMIWVTARPDDFQGPEVQGTPYPWATIPIGSCNQPLSVAEQKAQTRPGMLMPSGGILIATSRDARRHSVCNDQGIWLYEVPANEILFDLDTKGYLMTLDPRYDRVHKYNTKGQIVAAFPVDPNFYTGEGNVAISQGTIYWLHLDLEKREYRIVRWGVGK